MLTNATATVKGNKLTMVIDLDTDLGPSSTGKTELIAKGKAEVMDNRFVTLSVFKYPARKVILRKKS